MKIPSSFIDHLGFCSILYSVHSLPNSYGKYLRSSWETRLRKAHPTSEGRSSCVVSKWLACGSSSSWTSNELGGTMSWERNGKSIGKSHVSLPGFMFCFCIIYIIYITHTFSPSNSGFVAAYWMYFLTGSGCKIVARMETVGNIFRINNHLHKFIVYI